MLNASSRSIVVILDDLNGHALSLHFRKIAFRSSGGAECPGMTYTTDGVPSDRSARS